MILILDSYYSFVLRRHIFNFLISLLSLSLSLKTSLMAFSGLAKLAGVALYAASGGVSLSADYIADWFCNFVMVFITVSTMRTPLSMLTELFTLAILTAFV